MVLIGYAKHNIISIFNRAGWRHHLGVSIASDPQVGLA